MATDEGVAFSEIGAGTQLIDVRSPAEFAAGSVPGARNVPLEALEAEIPFLGGKVVTVCTKGQQRSRGAAERLRAAGIDATFLQGGVLAVTGRAASHS